MVRGGVALKETDYIDVDFSEVEENPNDKKEPENITINTDPISALFSGFFSALNTATESIKEYNICRQQEETKRSAIKAQMKVQLAQINAEKELFLQMLEDKHQIDMLFINHELQQSTKMLDRALNAVDKALEKAETENDFKTVIELIKYAQDISEMRSRIDLQLMDKVYSSNTVSIATKQPIGYLN